MKAKNLFLVASVLALSASCTSEDVQNPSENNNFKVEESVMEVAYKGKTYTVPYMRDMNDSIIYLGSEFKSIYDSEISRITNHVILERGENKVEYFLSQEDMYKALGLKLIDPKLVVKTRSNDDAIPNPNSFVNANDLAGRVILYDDRNFSDRSVTGETTFYRAFLCENLKNSYGFNDKTSSLRVWSFIPKNKLVPKTWVYADADPQQTFSTNNLRIVFLGYHNSNFSGSVFCCIPENDGKVHEHSNLKSNGWNDKISSVVLRIAVKDMFSQTDH